MVLTLVSLLLVAMPIRAQIALKFSPEFFSQTNAAHQSSLYAPDLALATPQHFAVKRRSGIDAGFNPLTIAKTAGVLATFTGSDEHQAPDCDRLGGADKARHAGIFFATTLGLQLFFQSGLGLSKTTSYILSAVVATTIGIGKELYDWKISDKNCFSEQDLLANSAGILAAGLVITIL